MSITQTYASASETTNKSSASTTFLTPQKRKRLIREPSLDEIEAHHSPELKPAGNQSLRSKILQCRKDISHSRTELYTWCFKPTSVAPVRVKHVFEMDNEDASQENLYWMGRVPCRSVKVVGIVVGIDEYDDMTRFKLDDGTAVIDCDFKHPLPKRVPTATKNSKYSLPERLKPTQKDVTKDGVPLDAPKVFVGAIISVRGRISQGRGTRFLRVEADGFSICKSANDEPCHWMEVIRLCREHYYLTEPFVIPKVVAQPDPKPTSNLPASSAPSSPVSHTSPSGTESSRSTTASPRRPRLRHPSRLHSRDLTDVTFRIYLKHYMDFAPPYSPSGSVSDDDDESFHSNDPCITPTPRSRYITLSSPLETPKPRKQRKPDEEAEKVEDDTIQYGFTLSYLRRVPVLAEMACAVVHAEHKRREKEKMKRGKDSRSQRSQPVSTSRSVPGSASDSLLLSRNMKRLYSKTIRDLYKDGNIIIWSGPARPCEHAFQAVSNSIGGSAGLWKVSSSRAPTLPSTSSSTSSDTYTGLTQVDDINGYLSEPDENEEAYLPVTARTIAPHVLRALRILTGTQKVAHAGKRKHRPPTVDELTLYLQKSDAQWANLGGWDVKAALEYMHDEDQVFKAGDDRWAACS